MNRKRIYCLLISVAMLFSLTACGRENCQEPKQGETLKDYANVGNSTPNSGNGVPIERPEFASMSEVKRFLADNPVADSTMTHIGQYVSENDAASISATADTIPFPVADLSPETTQFTASWIPNNKSLTIIYCINNLQYKFIYFLALIISGQVTMSRLCRGRSLVSMWLISGKETIQILNIII